MNFLKGSLFRRNTEPEELEPIFQSNSAPPGNPAGIRIDSKRRRRLMEKRMVMGHKADDHEEQTQYQQSM